MKRANRQADLLRRCAWTVNHDRLERVATAYYPYMGTGAVGAVVRKQAHDIEEETYDVIQRRAASRCT